MLGALGHHASQQVLELHPHLFDTLGRHDRQGRPASVFGQFDLDEPVIEFAEPQELAELLPRLVRVGRGRRRHAAGNCGGGRQQRIEEPFFGAVLGMGANCLLLLSGGHGHRQLAKVTNDRLHVPAHGAHLGELRGFDLDERSLRQTSEASGDLGLTHPRRSDHDDVLGCDLVAQFFGHLLAPPAVAQGNCHRALRIALADDVTVELRDDLSGREAMEGSRTGAHGIVTMLMRSFV